MSSQQSARPPTDAAGTLSLLAIARDNSVAHGYVDIEELLRSKTFLTRAGVEFFDSSGRRLAPVFNATWQLVGLEPTADEPDPRGIQRRLVTMIQKVNLYVRNNPDVFADRADARGTRGYADAGLVLPDVDGMDLAESLQAYTTILGHAEEEPSKDPGGPLHNLFHVLGGRHD